MDKFDKEEIQRIVDIGERKAKTWEVELLHQLVVEYGGKKEMCMCKTSLYFNFANKWLQYND